jgi:serine/threonine protein kinase/Tol biopolymer transport system component
MGEVYLARDTTLDRQVALKVLPDDVARDPDRIARFRREAQILAALNHPLIAAIYGVEDAHSTPVLVLELVEGPTLAERIALGPIVLDEALAIARQLAQALEAAHEQGIVHRDLKPANIKLRSDGTVKVLDFGLARALHPVSAVSAKTSDAIMTVTAALVTRPGMILGTTAYMSPEQARGLELDRGADIWAFGAVFFEMLTGGRAFHGEDATQTLASVMRSDPDWSRLPAGTPDSVRRVLRRCLEKERGRRLADIRDARLEIEDAQAGDSPHAASTTGLRSAERLAWIAALSLVAVVAAASLAWKRDPPSTTPRERWVEISTPPTPDPVSLALSPDGEKLAFIAFADGRPQLWVRTLTSATAHPLRGTDGAVFPFWSPDSRTIGFFAGEKLRRVELDGGSAPKVLGPAVIGPGATWSAEGTIVFPTVPDSPLLRISANGGAIVPVPGAEAKAPGQRYPQFLPDGRSFLYYVAETRGVYAGSLDAPHRSRLFEADAAAIFAPPAEVLFVRNGVLYAQRFDPAGRVLQGEPVRLASGIAVNPYGGAAVSASAGGSVAYRTGAATQERQFVWFNRSGVEISKVGKPDGAGPLNPSLSPDGRQIAFSRTVDGNTDLWLADVDRGVPQKFTAGQTPDICPVWGPGGASIVFSTPGAPGRPFGLQVKPVNTDGAAAPLLGIDLPLAIAMDYSRKGEYVIYRTSAVNSQWDIWAVPMTGNRTPFPFLQSPADERTAQLSPDARWIAYESNETGPFEIYIRPFPGPGRSQRVSVAGGSQPRWRSDGSELFYISPDGHLTVVPLRAHAGGADMTPGAATVLFRVPAASTIQGGLAFEYDVSADGQKFLVNTIVEQTAAPISLILNRKPIAK